MLLLGHFPNMERGPLDRTHLQFLTKDTVEQMMNQAGLTVHKFSATGVPLDEIWKNGEGRALFNVMMCLQHLAPAVAPRLFGCQWIMVARAGK
jgi:hypothetical protein